MIDSSTFASIIIDLGYFSEIQRRQVYQNSLLLNKFHVTVHFSIIFSFPCGTVNYRLRFSLFRRCGVSLSLRSREKVPCHQSFESRGNAVERTTPKKPENKNDRYINYFNCYYNFLPVFHFWFLYLLTKLSVVGL